MESGHDKFNELTKDLWAAFRWTADHMECAAIAPNEQINHMNDELDVRMLLLSFTTTFDSNDVAGLTDYFAPDAVLRVLPVGEVVVGRDMLFAHFERSVKPNRFFHRRMQNIIVRVPKVGEAWVSTYFHALELGDDNDAQARHGRLFGRAAKGRDQRWRFEDFLISVDHTRAFPKAIEQDEFNSR